MSGETGPSASSPSARAASMAGRILVGFLGAEQAAFAGVGIESGHGDAAALDAQLFQGQAAEPDGIQDARCPDPIQGLAKGQVGGDVDRPEVVDHQQHAYLGHPAQGGQILGVSGNADTRQLGGFLVDGAGHHGIQLLVQAGRHSGTNELQAGSAALLAHPAQLDLGEADVPEVQQMDAGGIGERPPPVPPPGEAAAGAAAARRSGPGWFPPR